MTDTFDATEDWTFKAPPIPAHWTYIPFEDAFQPLSTSKLKIPEAQYQEHGNFPIVDQGKEMIGGYTDAEDRVINQESSVVVFGDHTRCFKLINFPFAPGADGTKVLRPSAYLLPKFAFYGCLSLKMPDRGYSRHYSFLRKTKFPLAPENEQRRIVDRIEELFSELDKSIESLTTARNQLNVYRRAVLKHAFEGNLTTSWRKENGTRAESFSTLLERIRRASDDYYAREMHQWQAAIKKWEAHGARGKRPSKPEKPANIISISDDDITGLPSLPKSWGYARLATLAQIGSGMSVSKDRSLSEAIEVPYLRVANVQRGRLDLSHMVTMKIEQSQLRSLALKKWDILFNEGGDRDKLGRGWIWEEQIDPCITQNHVFRASPYLASEVHSKFVSYWGNTFGQKYFNTEGKQTTNLASINKRVLSSFPIPLPSMQEQTEIVSEIESRLSLADGLEAEIDAALERHSILRQSILSRAFSGKLTAQDSSDEPVSALLERIETERETTLKAKRNNRRKEAA